MRRHQVLRSAFFILLCLSVATVTTGAAAEDPAPDPAQAEATPTPEGEAAAEPVAEELPPLDCKPAELLDKIDAWSVDCVAMWLENLGFAELRGAFTGNKVDGPSLKGLTMEKLADDYGVSDEAQRKKIYYNLKDVVRKDSSSGNTNHYSQMLMWCLPFLGIYKWLTLKYDKQIARATKRYKKWQEARNPPKPVEPVVYADGTNEWISGVNRDVGGGSGVPKKKEKKAEKKEKKPKTPKAD